MNKNNPDELNFMFVDKNDGETYYLTANDVGIGCSCSVQSEFGPCEHAELLVEAIGGEEGYKRLKQMHGQLDQHGGLLN